MVTGWQKWLLLLLFCGYCFSEKLAEVVVKIDSSTNVIAFTQSKRELKNISISKEAALRGENGILLNSQIEVNLANWWVAETTFNRDSWLRFYMRIDSIHNIVSDTSRFSFLSERFSTPTSSDVPGYGINFYCEHVPPSTVNLVIRTHFSGSRDSYENFRLPLQTGRAYCIELHTLFVEDTTIQLSLFIDGKIASTLSRRLAFSPEFMRLYIFCGKFGPADWCVSLDEFCVSDRRPRPIPVKDELISEEIINGSFIRLICADFLTSYHGESLRARRWQLFSQTDTMFPLFDAIETNPLFFTSRKISFPLDKGRYFWRTAPLNNFSIWGDWSKRGEFEIKTATQHNISLTNLYISKTNSKEKLAEIQTNKWYDINFKINIDKWHNVGYLLIWICSDSNAFGNPMNKGGLFNPSSNYVINLSLFDNANTLYIKDKSGTAQTTKVAKDSMSLYVDNRIGAFFIDTITGMGKIRFRLLDEANAGKWYLCGAAIDGGRTDEEKTSIVMRSSFITVKGSDFAAIVKIVLIICFVSAFILASKIIMLKKSEGKADGPLNNAVYSDILSYIETNIEKKIITDDILKELKISSGRFYQAMRSQNSEFSKLLNQIRIKRAKELMENGRLNITEIGYKVGFSESKYFAKVFRDIEGVSPSEYRKALLEHQ